MAYTKTEKKIIAAAPVECQEVVKRRLRRLRRLRNGVIEPPKKNEKVVDRQLESLLECYDRVRASWARRW